MKKVTIFLSMLVVFTITFGQTKTPPTKKPEKEIQAPSNQVTGPTSASESINAKPAIPEAIPQAPAVMNSSQLYQITNYGGKVLAPISGGERKANILLQEKTSGPHQQWIFIPAGNDFYYIFNEAKRYCLEVEGNIVDGAKLKLERPNGSANQKFKIIPIGNNHYWLQTANDLNVAAQNTNAGANVGIKPKAQDIEQRWTITVIQ